MLLRPLYKRIIELTNAHTGYHIKPEGQEGLTIIQYNIDDQYTYAVLFNTMVWLLLFKFNYCVVGLIVMGLATVQSTLQEEELPLLFCIARFI